MLKSKHLDFPLRGPLWLDFGWEPHLVPRGSSCMRIMFAVVGEEGGWLITSNPDIFEIYKHIQRWNQSAMNRS